MTSRQRRARALLGSLAVIAGMCWCGLIAWLVLGEPVAPTRLVLLTAAWGCGLGAVVLAVAAAQEHSDPDDDPRYLQTVLHGFVDEWRR